MTTKTRQSMKVRAFTVLLSIIGSAGTCIQGCQAQQCSPGLTKTHVFPVCPYTLVSYTCTVAGTNFTTWTGSRFFQFCNDTLNETIITHYYNESTEIMNFTFINMSECGPFVAIRNDTGTTDGCYVSSLKFIASSPAIFNNTSVECLDGDGKEIGIDIVKIAGPPSIPLNLRLNDCDESVRTLTLVWDKPASNGGSAIVQYGLTVEPVVPQCSGICYVDANTTKFQFGPLNTNTQYTFTVHADNCNATQQGDQNNITVFYGGPAGPVGLSASLVFQEDELLTIKSIWQEVVPLDIPSQCNLPVIGFEISYVSYFTDPVTFNINLDYCFEGTCSHTYDIVDSDIPMYTLTVSTKSLLGAGPPTRLDLISAKNDFVNITVNASTPFPEASCHFLCGLGEATAAKCSISYSIDAAEVGLSNSFTDAPMANGSLGETVSFPLTEPLPPNTLYYYQAVGFTADRRVTVNGNFSTGNYSRECDPVQLVAGNASNTDTTICGDGNEGVVNKDNYLLVCYNGSTPGSVATLSCSDGYSLGSDSVTGSYTCQVNGLWNYYPTKTCRKDKDFGPVIGGSVGGILGLILVIAVIAIMITYCKYRKTSQKKNEAKNVAVNYTQGKYGAAEEIQILTSRGSTDHSTDGKC